MISDTTLTMDINGCARCKANGHKGLEFKAFKLPVYDPARADDLRVVFFTHWATCPITGDPILLGVVTE